MDSQLSRLLPEALAKADDARATLAHLHTLHRVLTTYVPREVIAVKWEHHIIPPLYEVREASLLFADVSGFTALSEQHASLGREGAEQMTLLLNQYFGEVLAIIEQYGGSVLKFGGDALVVAFYEGAHARTAASTALALQQQIGRWEARGLVGMVPLRLGIGVGSGTLRLLQLGNEQRREIVLLGHAAEEIAEAEEQAAAGEVVVGRTTAAALPPTWLAREAGALAWLEPTTPPDPAPLHHRTVALAPADEQAVITQLTALAPYLPEGILTRLVLDPASRIEGEHRMVTMLFANLVNLPPYPRTASGQAALTTILQDHFVTMQEIVARYGGTLNKIDVAREGYKVLALFGAPRAHEDDESRALLAALAMQEAIAGVNERAAAHLDQPAHLQQRIGIHAGVVLAGNVGSIARQEYSVIGDPVNLAARLMGEAAPGELLISPALYHKLAPYLQATALPPVHLKGKSEPVTPFRVAGWRKGTPPRGTSHTPLVGRAAEMEALREAVAQARAGHGQAFFLYGEAGIGKSRLLAELLPEATDFLFLDGRCLSYGASIPYHPWRPVLHSLLELPELASAEEQLAHLQARLGHLLPGQLPLLPLLGPVLGQEIPATATTAPLPPQLRQQRLQGLIRQLMATVATGRPLLLVMEDVHWIDDASAALLAFVARNVAAAPILILMLGRVPPTEQFVEQGGDLLALPFFHALPVQELEAQAAQALIHTLRARLPLPASDQPLVTQRAGGNPLYIEELVEALASEQGHDVPDTLQGLIMSRLDRLPELNRRVMQVASVIGRRFDYPVLQDVYPYQDLHLIALAERLDELVESEFLLVERFSPHQVYLFRQVLTHEVAYESLLFTRRRELHQRVAHYLAANSAGTVGDRTGLLSYHLFHAQQWAEALPPTLLAADRAKESYANEAAITLYRRALTILAHLDEKAPAPWVRVWQALADVLKLVGQLDEAMAVYQQALDRSEDPQQRIELYVRQVRTLGAQGAYPRALDLLQAAKTLAAASPTLKPFNALQLDILRAWIHLLAGEYATALELIEPPVKQLQHSRTASPGHTTALAEALSHASYIKTALQRLPDALTDAQQALILWDELRDVRAIAATYDSIAQIYWAQNHKDQALEALRHSMEARRKIGDAFGLASGLNNLGVVNFHLSHTEEAEASYRESLALARQIGNVVVAALALTNLGELLVAQSRLAEAEQALAEAEQAAHQAGHQGILQEIRAHREKLVALRSPSSTLEE